MFLLGEARRGLFFRAEMGVEGALRDACEFHDFGQLDEHQRSLVCQRGECRQNVLATLDDGQLTGVVQGNTQVFPLGQQLRGLCHIAAQLVDTTVDRLVVTLPSLQARHTPGQALTVA